ncbi:MAG: hypothetical protein F6K21_30735, partial [Symploca sp. SIO2D2]|nr:hypothetical protein [Symploca sp. SIO2D2]
MGHGNLAVMLYGIHANFLHLPLIWVIGKAFNREDIFKIGFVFLVTTIPNTYLMKLQFDDPYAWVSKGVGMDSGGQLDGGSGKIRPPGLFTFITGNNMFYPLAAAFLLMYFLEPRKLKIYTWGVIAMSAICIILAQPLSISRTMMLATGIVIVSFVAAMAVLVAQGKVPGGKFFGFLTVAIFASCLLYFFVPEFQDGIKAFSNRWEAATGEKKGGVESAIVARFFSGFTNAIKYTQYTAGFFGSGIGMGTNVGSRFLTGEVSFLLAEDEWGRLVLEMGALFGMSFILMRVILTIHLGIFALRQFLVTKNAVPFLVMSAAGLPVLQGQLGSSTMLGFTVIGAGFLLASGNIEQPEEEEDYFDEDEEEEDPYKGEIAGRANRKRLLAEHR